MAEVKIEKQNKLKYPMKLKSTCECLNVLQDDNVIHVLMCVEWHKQIAKDGENAVDVKTTGMNKAS